MNILYSLHISCKPPIYSDVRSNIEFVVKVKYLAYLNQTEDNLKKSYKTIYKLSKYMLKLNYVIRKM
jgi:hypothetical protein